MTSMKRKQKAAWFISGILVAVLAANIISPALALVQQTIAVYSGVNVYVDDAKLNPTDANGNTVPVFAYNGTTYLPIRAISDALGIAIQYEGSTQSVYVGKHSTDKPTVWIRNMDYFIQTNGGFTSTSSMKDNLGNEHSNVIYTKNYTFGGQPIVSQTYLLNGQYSAVSGTLFQNYDYRSDTQINYIEIYGDGEQLYRGTVAGGEFPVNFKVDLTGVLQLQIVLGFYLNGNDAYAGVADLGLWT